LSVRVTTVAVEKRYYIFWWRVCRFSYAACNAHALSYIVTFPAVQYFSTLSHKRHDFRKKVLNTKWVWFSIKIMCVLSFSTTFVWNIFQSKKNSAKYSHERAQVLKQSTGYSGQKLKKLVLSRQIFDKYSNIKFHENPSTGSRTVPSKMTDMTW
jgi:hypothetical protein